MKAFHRLYKFLSHGVESSSVLPPWCQSVTFFSHTFDSVLANSITIISANKIPAILLLAYLFVFGATAVSGSGPPHSRGF